MAIRVNLNSDKCIGCVKCTRSNNFEMGLDGRAHQILTEVEELGCIPEVARSCPVDAIWIQEIKRIYCF